jgi:tetratricopeptide (TPR) repeat protein
LAQLEALLEELENHDQKADLDALRRVREQIVLEHAGTDAAVEALYKIGLDLLFRERNLEQAVLRFEEAAKRRVAYWSDAARTSLGLCYFHQRRAQKALLELRKVAYPDKPNVHSITALSFIETIYESEGKDEEVRRVRKDRIAQLEQLVKQVKAPAERGQFLFQLGLACRDQGDDARADAALNEAKKLGADVLGADLFRSVVELLG